MRSKPVHILGTLLILASALSCLCLGVPVEAAGTCGMDMTMAACCCCSPDETVQADVEPADAILAASVQVSGLFLEAGSTASVDITYVPNPRKSLAGRGLSDRSPPAYLLHRTLLI